MVWNRPQINLYELSSGAKYRSTASNNLISIKALLWKTAWSLVGKAYFLF